MNQEVNFLKVKTATTNFQQTKKLISEEVVDRKLSVNLAAIIEPISEKTQTQAKVHRR